jgi:signal transduction histidine kinase
VSVIEQYDDVPDVTCVAAELNQVFMNLLLNAADALRPDGTLSVHLRRDGHEACVAIQDDGCGIDPRDLPRLFEPFFTTKPVGAGRGLGLAISHAIVARHGGRIDVSEPSGGGALFVVRLPLESARLDDSVQAA